MLVCLHVYHCVPTSNQLQYSVSVTDKIQAGLIIIKLKLHSIASKVARKNLMYVGIFSA